MDLMKERFANLLLGEDISGGGKGVSSALALSNAITNLAGSCMFDKRRKCIKIAFMFRVKYEYGSGMSI